MARPADRLPPVLQHGFRPFFLLGALWAAAALGLWLAALAGALALPSAFDPVAWHRHEMLFGSLAAREIAAGVNRRKLPVVALVGLLALADLLSHLESLGASLPEMLGDRLAIAVAATLVGLIGGRIVPSFTTDWL